MESRFQAGFAECAREVTRFVHNTDVDTTLRSRLLGHLASCLASLPSLEVDSDGSSSTTSSVIVKAEHQIAPEGLVALSCAQQEQCLVSSSDLNRLPESPLNLASSSRSVSSSSTVSSGISTPASPFSDSESTTSASEDNYGEVMRMEMNTFGGVIRRAPAMFCDPVWRPW